MNEAKQNTTNLGRKPLPLVAIHPSDLEAVKELVELMAPVPEGALLPALTLAQQELKLKYFGDFKPAMWADLAAMWVSLKGSTQLAQAEADGVLSGGRPDAYQYQLQKGQMVSPLPAPTISLELEELQKSAQEDMNKLRARMLGTVSAQGSTSSQTIDRKKTFGLPRFWWLWPWSAVKRLRARCETLADVYDGDMRFMAEQMHAENRWKLKAGFQQTSLTAVKHKTALEKIAALRTPACASIGRRMADIADEALK